MKLLFFHHQQRRDYREEPGYNELFRPFTKARQVTGWAEFVYQTPLRRFLLEEAERVAGPCTGDVNAFIGEHLTLQVYRAANLRLQPLLEQAIAAAGPDLIVYSLTWPSQSIQPAILADLKARFPRNRVFVQQWDSAEGSQFFHGFECATIEAADYFAVCDNHERLRRMRAGVPPYDQYRHVERVHWLPTVPDPDLYRPVAGAKDIDVLVLGASGGQRSPVIDALQARYGAGFRHLGGYAPGDTYISIEDYVAAINRAKIVVNTQTAGRYQLKGRVREVLSCGGFLLEQDNSESREFLAGSGVVMFAGRDDLFPAIDAYLADDAARERIARAARAWYLERYTPDLVMQQIIDAVF